MMLNRRKGFSLMELLVVVALLPVVAIAIYSNFRSAVGIWKQATLGIAEEDLSLVTVKIGRDFHSAFNFADIAFQGDQQTLEMASFVQPQEKLGGDRTIGQVKYYYDAGKKTLMREERNVSEIFKEKSGRVSLLLPRVTNFHISYFLLDPEYKKYTWITEWSGKKTMPLAVRFEYDYGGPQGPEKVSRTFLIPAGG